MKLCCLLSAICCSLSTLSAQWEPDRRLSTTDSAAALNENMGRCLVTCADTVHVVWYDWHNNGTTIYYKRNPTGDAAFEESSKPPVPSPKPDATIVRGELYLQGPGTRSGLLDNPVMSLAALLDISERNVLNLHAGANGVSRLAPGVCFVRGTHRTRKAVIQH